MSLHLLRSLPSANRAATCIRLASSRSRCYSAQPALQLRPDIEHEVSTSSTTADVPSHGSVHEIKPKKTKKLVKAKSPATSQPSKDPLEPTGVDKFLARLQSEGLEPTLADLDKFRPARFPNKYSLEYVHAYNSLADTLCRSFSRAQLQAFVAKSGLYKDRKPKPTKKLDFAEVIIEKRWNWPSLEEVERVRRDRTEIVTENFPVTRSQLFLILGKDGANLLQLSMKYNAHMSLIPEPLSLRLEGLRPDLRELIETLSSLKKDIVEDTLRLPTRAPIRADLLQRISRLAGAYIENIGEEGLIRICAKDENSLSNAKRLASRASAEMASASSVPVVSYVPSGVPIAADVPEVMSPYAYALYPFLSPRALPLLMNTAGAFRVRRVGEWLGEMKGESIEKTGGLAGGKGQLLSVEQQPVDLRDLLFAPFPPQEGRRRIIKATTGHVLFATSSKGQRATLQPPLKGSHQFSKVLAWIKRSDARASFVSSLPASLVHSPPNKQQIIHRLLYIALPSDDSAASGHDKITRRKIITYEVALTQLKTAGTGELGLIPQCEIGTEAVLHLMMPDRPMDIQFSGRETESLSEESLIPELREYTHNLRQFLNGSTENVMQPDPPLSVQLDGDTYVLQISASVRQSVEQIPQRAGFLSAISESVLDLESSQRTTACEIYSGDPMSPSKWEMFLAGCDTLSIVGYRAPSVLPLEMATTEL